MLIHLIGDLSEDAFLETNDFQEFYEWLEAKQRKSTAGGSYYYDIYPDTDEHNGRVIRIQEHYFGNDE